MSAAGIGVYAIYLTGTPYVYVGQAKNVARRWRQHRDDWVWPNEAEYTLLREMPGSTTQQRHHTEAAAMRLLKRRGFLMLSESSSVTALQRPQIKHLISSRSLSFEERSEMSRRGQASRTPEQRREWARKVQAKITPEQRREMLRNLHEGRNALTFQQRSAAASKAAKTLGPRRRREIALKREASMAPEDRSARTRKGWCKRARAA